MLREKTATKASLILHGGLKTPGYLPFPCRMEWIVRSIERSSVNHKFLVFKKYKQQNFISMQ